MEHIRVSDKIRLESLKLSMAPVIFETIDRDRAYLRQWLPFVDSTSELRHTESFIHSITSTDNKRDMIYSIWYNEEFAGLIGFKDTDSVNKKTEIGYWLAEKMQQKGIVTDCVKTLVKVAFQKLGLNRVQIKVAENNTKSEAIPQRLNFQFEGIERAGELHRNKFLDLKIYSLLKHDRY
jgi:ribosomal-protein-serine acetyltransferase